MSELEKRVGELEQELERLSIEKRTTSRERDEARESYYRAADRGDNEGKRTFGSQWDECEGQLAAFRKARTNKEGELSQVRSAYYKELAASATPEELFKSMEVLFEMLIRNTEYTRAELMEKVLSKAGSDEDSDSHR